MIRTNRLFAAVAVSILGFGCADKQASETPHPDTRNRAAAMQESNLDVVTSQDFGAKYQSFDSYWFRGKAEINRFELTQSRYGELHEGDAVMIFVTEPFDTAQDVKYEGIGGKEAVEQVLKLNNYRRFYTGVYPYTIMTSTFSPTNGNAMEKLTHTVNEWCGQVFSQLNLNPEKQGYNAVSYSYFQSEGDREFDIESTLLEDELYTKIRLGPEELPTGEIELLPSLNYLRLMHKPWEVATATATLGEPARTEYSESPVRTYELNYPSHNRTLKIFFEADFPHRIVGFEDSRKALFNRQGGEPEEMTTKGKLTRSIMLDYWSKNRRGDAAWRDALGLEW